MKRHLEKAAESFNVTRTASEPFATPKRDEFAVFSGMTNTVHTVASAPLPLLYSSMSSTPSPPETHRTASASGPTSRPSQPTVSQPSLRPASIETESPPWNQVHPALIDQLLFFESQMEPPRVAGGGYVYGPSALSDASRTPLQFSMSKGPESPSGLATTQQALRGHPRSLDPRYSENSTPTSATSDASALDARWDAPHATMQPQFARPVTPPPGLRTRDPVLRQSNSLSLNDLWSQFMMQMDTQPAALQRPP